MPPQMPLPDEQEFDQPAIISGMPNQDLNYGNNPFYYFTSSPWFEPMCINVAVLNNLHMMDASGGQQVMNDRKLWDERLRREQQGVQFMITGEPQGEGQPWVLQRQNKVPNPDGKVDIHVEGNWYTQGTKVLMAPSLLDVVESRLLLVSTRMQQMAEISKNLTHWSPATGYSYYPPSYEAGTKAAAAAGASRLGSPTLAPADADAAASQSHSHTQAAAAAAAEPTQATSGDASASTTSFSDALFMQSLGLTNAYGHEYMDENALKGEPGAFVFENTRMAVDARNKAKEQQQQQQQQQQQKVALTSAPITSTSISSSSFTTTTTTTSSFPLTNIKPDPQTQPSSTAPSATGTPGPTTEVHHPHPHPHPNPHSRKGSSVAVGAPKNKKNRRKSQGGVGAGAGAGTSGSPTTPGGVGPL